MHTVLRRRVLPKQHPVEGLNELEDGSEIFLDLASSIPMVLALLQEGLFGPLAHLFLEDFAEARRSK